ncbi:potassium channel family protein [Aureimonas phyllosphaerae]|uniref:Voltage-gated potassium channel n=1 Tax=Aureimonas phyllosphaerae TaxID=1166078 RepID=A0A7W6FUN4_9HYPH|nr:potassium channel family protein [Aureimonas phyllosphaerae]MBB3936273.1 voltage-gated potassium channel [Aureimonas phyllosphaerae]MBB3960002.1 voltage-gated potassium channel [Aureimonas phyllosphaerae]SFF47582.1 voltage-gated potassium channel [Aureimonas phyllosphaerae]
MDAAAPPRLDPDPPSGRFQRFRRRLDFLYHADHPTAVRFQGWIAIVDLVVIAFFVMAPVLEEKRYFLWLDYSLAALLLLDFSARALAAPSLKAWARRPVIWVDALILLTLLLPAMFFNVGFLRILRLWTLSRKDVLWRPLRRRGWQKWEEAGRAVINLLTCLFLATGFIYTAFVREGSGIEGYIDALYFTVATMTTTGFGDVTLPGPAGKLTSVVIMIVGISLFVRLAQTVFRPYKVFFRCPACALERHEPDAVHCKACGHILAIPDAGGD